MTLGKIEDQRQWKSRVVCKLPVIIGREVSGQDTVLRRRGTDPFTMRTPTRRVIQVSARRQKMGITRFGLIDVACPEQADVTVLAGVAARDALESQFDHFIVDQLIAQATL